MNILRRHRVSDWIAILSLSVTSLAVTAGVATVRAEDDTKDSLQAESRFMTHARRLTYEGRRAGEGYFRADGKWMVFQSEREPGNPFFQIYLMSLETGDTRQMSTGIGRTTCAWIHPDMKKVLFASTHEDPDARQKQEEEYKKRAAAESKRPAWVYDEHYEIYERNLDTNQLNRLTDAVGYDAEGSYSPDGSLILFASNRHAYAQTNRRASVSPAPAQTTRLCCDPCVFSAQKKQPKNLSQNQAEPLSRPGKNEAANGFGIGSKTSESSNEDMEIFERDRSYLMDIYIMKADGSDVRRLTNVPGYDGGPFFSADGQRICWRRFSKDGLRAEIYTMKVDGSDQSQITHIGAMSWAPFFHPSEKYLIFTTNRHGFDNFELYIVDAAGSRTPVRVTHTPGFDGLPTFSPNGNKISWTSTRPDRKNGQIFLANWNHQAALEAVTNSSKNTTPARRDPTAN